MRVFACEVSYLHVWMLVTSYRCSTGGSRFSKCVGESQKYHQLNESPKDYHLIHTLFEISEMCRWIIPIITDAISHVNIIDSFMHCSRISKCVENHELMPTFFVIFEMCRGCILHNVCTYDISGGVGHNGKCVRVCMRVCVCAFVRARARAFACVCVRARVRAFDHNPCHTQKTCYQRSSSLYPRRAHSPWHWLCRYMYVAVCCNVCCVVLRSSLYPRRTHSPWQWRCWYICVVVLCCSLHCSVL